MKIAFFTDIFLPSIGGIELSILNLSTGLVMHGHEVLIFSPTSDKPVELPKGIRIQHLKAINKPFGIPYKFAAPYSASGFKTVKEFNPDIIHFHTPFGVGGFGIYSAKKLKIPLVGTFHSYFMEPEYLASMHIIHPPILTKALWKYTAAIYNMTDQVITPTERTRVDIMKHGITKPIQAVTNAINEPNVKVLPKAAVTEMRKKLKLKKNVVLYVGRLSAEKSIDVVIKSMKKVIEKAPDSSLCIVGRGPDKELLEKLAETEGLADHVVFTEPQSAKDLLGGGYYQLGDIFVSASKSETQGMTFIEAMCFKLPVIGVSERGAQDVVGPVGLLARPDDPTDLAAKILSLLTDTERREKYAAKSYKCYRETYSYDTVIGIFEALYKNLLK